MAAGDAARRILCDLCLICLRTAAPNLAFEAALSAGPKDAPRVGIVSLGCPKALVDSRAHPDPFARGGLCRSRRDYGGADVVLVNTCGFLESAREESLEAIGEALAENGRVIVTGCLGAEPSRSAWFTRPSSRSPARINMRR